MNESTGRGKLTPLHIAVKNRQPAIVKELPAAPAIEVDAKDLSGRTPLFYADPKPTKMLLAAGADPNVRLPDKAGIYPPGAARLHEASLGMTSVLLAAGADPNIQDASGSSTPLHRIDEKETRTRSSPP
ncbi:MAG: hypothetical protein R3F11_17590 [Verrucomicrobiales bacterium]